MPIPTITLPLKLRGNPWNRGLVACLRQLPQYNLATVQFAPLPGLRYARGSAGNLLKINDHFIYLDTWDFCSPTYFVLADIDNLPVDLKAIIKIQRREDYDFPNKRNIPVVEWTMFHTAQMNWLANQPTRRAKYLAKKNKKHSIGFTGRLWKHRKAWGRAMVQIDRSFYAKLTGTTNDYIEMVCDWEIGAIFAGKRDKYTDGKNRREPEFASLGVPILMNYKPFYMNEFIPGEHYEYVEKAADLKNVVENMTENRKNELATNAYRWWLENASQEGVCKSFMQRVESLGLL